MKQFHPLKIERIEAETGDSVRIALAVPAAAQDADTIIVTAQRREENLQEIPVSVGTLGGEALQVATGAGVSVII